MDGEQDLQAADARMGRQNMIEPAEIIENAHVEPAALAIGMPAGRFAGHGQVQGRQHSQHRQWPVALQYFHGPSQFIYGPISPLPLFFYCALGMNS